MSGIALDMAPARVRSAWLVPTLVVVLAAAVAWWASVPYVVGVFHDDGVYALLARSIATGQGFRYLGLPGLPAAAHYPPLYPLLLAAVWRVNPAFPENIPALLALNPLCIGVAALGLYHLLRRWFAWRPESAAATALAATIGIPVLSLSGALLSEPLFLAGLPVALLLSQSALDDGDRRSAIVAGVAIGLLMLVRTHAVALLGAAGLLLLLRRDWWNALWLGAAAVAVQLPWLLWCRSASPLVAPPLNGAYGAYPEFFKEGWRAGGLSLFTATIASNVHELWLLLGDRVWGGLGFVLGLGAALLLLALIALGAWRSAARAPVLPLFLALHIAVLALMSCAPPRYAWVVWPFFVALAVLGADTVLSRATRPALRVAAFVVLAVPFAAMARTEVLGYAVRAWEQPARNASRAIAPLIEWIRHSTPANAVVLVEGEEIATLFTGRQAAPPVSFKAMECAVPPSAADNRRALSAMLDAVPAQYVVSLTPGIVAAARTLPELRQIDSLPGAGMFEVRR